MFDELRFVCCCYYMVSYPLPPPLGANRARVSPILHACWHPAYLRRGGPILRCTTIYNCIVLAPRLCRGCSAGARACSQLLSLNHSSDTRPVSLTMFYRCRSRVSHHLSYERPLISRRRRRHHHLRTGTNGSCARNTQIHSRSSSSSSSSTIPDHLPRSHSQTQTHTYILLLPNGQHGR